ncbi:hypothetical protein DM01DRAFT_1268275, partial [Hesseltinella vesiculosa]
IQRTIQWIRMTVLVLSVLIIMASLSQYSRQTLPILSLFKNDEDMPQAVIHDRRLIATLVASQASIFCPLFLLMSQNADTTSTPTTIFSIGIHPSSSFWRIAFDLFCQFLMPLGLVLSWLFCISFDHKTALLLD